MDQRAHAAHTPRPVLEPEGDVAEDHDQGENHGDDGVAPHFAGDGGVHTVAGDDTVRVLKRGGETFEGDRVGVEALQRVEEFAFDETVGRIALVVHHVFGGDAHLRGTTELLDFGGFLELVEEGCTHLLRGDRLVETDGVGTAAAEVDAEGEALGEDEGQADQADDTGDEVGLLAHAEEVDVRVLEETARPFGGEGDVLVAFQTGLENEAGDEDRGEHRGDDTDYEHGGKAFDRTAAEEVEDDTGQDRGDLAVEDGRVGVLVTVADGQAESLAGVEFLFDTLVDDHVGVDRHTHRQHETCDTGEGEHRTEGSEGAEQEEHVAEQCDVGGHTGLAVEDDHIDQHQDEGDDEGDQTVADGFTTQGRADHLLLHDAGGGGELTALEHVGKVVGIGLGEVARDRGVAAADLVLHVRIGIDLTVHHDGDLATDVLTGDVFPFDGTLAVHGHAHFRGAGHLVVVDVGRGNVFAVEGGTLADVALEGHEFEIGVGLDAFTVESLEAPGGEEVAREEVAVGVDPGVDLGGVAVVGDTQQGGVATHRLQTAEERVGLHQQFAVGVAGLVGGSGELGLERAGVGSGLRLLDGGLLVSFRALEGFELHPDSLVEFLQIRLEFLGSVGLPEFEGGGTLEEFADTLRLLHARKLHEDAARAGDLLDVGLRHTELVDTALDDLVGVVDGALGLFLEEGDDLLVGCPRLVLHVAAELVEVDIEGKAFARGHFVPSLGEEGDEVFVGLVGALGGEGHGLVEFFRGLFTGAGTHEFGQVELQDDVHTALEVQTEVEFLLLDVLVGVIEINLLVCDRIEILLVGSRVHRVEIESPVKLRNLCKRRTLLHFFHDLGGRFGSFAFLDGRCRGKRQLEQAG